MTSRRDQIQHARDAQLVAQQDREARYEHQPLPEDVAEAESGQVFLVQMQKAFDELAELAQDEQLKAWRKSRGRLNASQRASKSATAMATARAHRHMLEEVFLGNGVPVSRDIKKVVEVAAQVRGSLYRGALRQMNQDKKLFEIQDEISAAKAQLEAIKRQCLQAGIFTDNDLFETELARPPPTGDAGKGQGVRII